MPFVIGQPFSPEALALLQRERESQKQNALAWATLDNNIRQGSAADTRARNALDVQNLRGQQESDRLDRELAYRRDALAQSGALGEGRLSNQQAQIDALKSHYENADAASSKNADTNALKTAEATRHNKVREDQADTAQSALDRHRAELEDIAREKLHALQTGSNNPGKIRSRVARMIDLRDQAKMNGDTEATKMYDDIIRSEIGESIQSGVMTGPTWGASFKDYLPQGAVPGMGGSSVEERAASALGQFLGGGQGATKPPPRVGR